MLVPMLILGAALLKSLFLVLMLMLLVVLGQAMGRSTGCPLSSLAATWRAGEGAGAGAGEEEQAGVRLIPPA